MIGCDSSGNQARGLAHYLNKPEYTKRLLEGDVHQFNADALTRVLWDMHVDFKVPRSSAKRILYAFLFGAAGKTMWSYIFGVGHKENGDELKKGFTKSTPGFEGLISALESEFNISKRINKRKGGSIISLAGNKIYVDSKHKLLVYLLQACEKITCVTALMYTVDQLRKERIPYQPCIMYHDEIDFMVPDEYAERAAEIGALAFAEGPKAYGVKIMAGEGLIGNNWYDVH
jgi:DNA polymerase-1